MESMQQLQPAAVEAEEEEFFFQSLRLRDFWDIFAKRWLWILLAVAVCAGGMFLYDRMSYTPEYTSTATLYILRQNEDGSVSGSSEDFSLALKVVNDCDWLLRSHSVLDEVIQELDLDMSYAELYKRVSTSNPSSTRILKVTVKAPSAKLAKEIVDCICRIGPDKIAMAMGFDQVNLFELGTLETSPSNAMSMKKYVKIGLAAAAGVYLVFLLMFLLDCRIRSAADVERMLGLTVLGELPDANAPVKKGHGAYGQPARKGKRVLVIDADMRKSVMAGRHTTVRNPAGLSQVLTGMSSIGQCVYATQFEGLHIMFAGQFPPNPADLLAGKYFPALIEESRKYYDYIFVDTAPLGKVIDAALVARCCDGSVLVMGNDVRYSLARNVVNQLKKSGRVLGVVRNMVPKGTDPYYR